MNTKMTAPADGFAKSEIPVTDRVFSQLYREDWMTLARFEMSELERRAGPLHGWQPIETAPKDGTRVLLWDGDGLCIAHFEPSVSEWQFKWNGAGEWVITTIAAEDGNYSETFQSPTHWQPLPPPPSFTPPGERAESK